MQSPGVADEKWVLRADMTVEMDPSLNRDRRFWRRGVFAVMALGVMAACGSTAAATTTTTTPTGTSASGVVPLVVYSAQGYNSVTTKAFQAATGIPVKLDDDSTGPLLTKVAAERNNPQWGLLWVDGATAFAALDQQGQLLDYSSPTDADNSRSVAGSIGPLVRADQHDRYGRAHLQRGKGARGPDHIPGSPPAAIQGTGRDERSIAVGADVSRSSPDS